MNHRPRLALFDLDHTLLDGDSDVLWCEFLMAQGVLDRARFAQRNAETNDLPLLRFAKRAVVVNADERLAVIAAAAGWPSISIRR